MRLTNYYECLWSRSCLGRSRGPSCRRPMPTMPRRVMGSRKRQTLLLYTKTSSQRLFSSIPYLFRGRREGNAPDTNLVLRDLPLYMQDHQGRTRKVIPHTYVLHQEAQFVLCTLLFLLLFLISLDGSFVWRCPCGCGWCTATRHPGVLWYTARSCGEQRGLVSQTSQHCKGKGYRTGQDGHQMALKREFD